jgi:hypothetical protein
MRTSGRIAVAVVAAAAATTTVLTGAGSAGAAGAAHVRTITARVGKHAIRLSSGHDIAAATVWFRVVGVGGEHELQIVRLHHGYTAAQFGRDLGRAFAGKVRAVRRVDDNTSFRGGASGSPGHPGWFAVDLAAGHYVLLDAEGNAASYLDVSGKDATHPAIAHTGYVNALSYGFANGRLPAAGTIRVGNVSDQPHVVELQHVKASTTRRDVARFIKSGAHHNPPWALPQGDGTGVVSPYRHMMFRYHLPAGKYLMLCYWPSDDNGMPHYMMGMWKLVHLH